MGSWLKGTQPYHSLEVRRVWLPWEWAGRKQPGRECKSVMVLVSRGGAPCHPRPASDMVDPRCGHGREMAAPVAPTSGQRPNSGSAVVGGRGLRWRRCGDPCLWCTRVYTHSSWATECTRLKPI